MRNIPIIVVLFMALTARTHATAPPPKPHGATKNAPGEKKVKVATVTLKNNLGEKYGKVLAFKKGVYIKILTVEGDETTILAVNIEKITFSTISVAAWNEKNTKKIELPPDDDAKAPKDSGNLKNPYTTAPTEKKDIELPDDDEGDTAKEPATPAKPKPGQHGDDHNATEPAPGEQESYALPRPAPVVLTKAQKALRVIGNKWLASGKNRLILLGGLSLGISVDSDFNDSLGGCSEETFVTVQGNIGVEWDHALSLPVNDYSVGSYHSWYLGATYNVGLHYIDERIRSCSDCSVACGSEINDSYGYNVNATSFTLSSGLRVGLGSANKAKDLWEGWRLGIGYVMNNSELGLHALGIKVDLDHVTISHKDRPRDLHWRFSLSFFPSIAEMPMYVVVSTQVLWF